MGKLKMIITELSEFEDHSVHESIIDAFKRSEIMGSNKLEPIKNICVSIRFQLVQSGDFSEYWNGNRLDFVKLMMDIFSGRIVIERPR